MDAKSCCACCGIAEIDEIKLVPCDGCDLVRYCGDECKREHKSEHEEDCKKRAAELRDELLFKQPEGSHLGDCPICMIPLPIEMGSGLMTCCSKFICNGCYHAGWMQEIERRLEHSCPFCRKPKAYTREEADKQNVERVGANDPAALCDEGLQEYEKGNYSKAFEFYTKAAELGHAAAHYQLARMYFDGGGIEKDQKLMTYHLEEAAIGGHPRARYNLGAHEWNNNRNAERAVKHYIIAAAQGLDESTDTLKKKFREGYVSKEDLAAALRAHQAAVDETKSPQRDKAEEIERSLSTNY